jgi:hypothetical protein
LSVLISQKDRRNGNPINNNNNNGRPKTVGDARSNPASLTTRTNASPVMMKNYNESAVEVSKVTGEI